MFNILNSDFFEFILSVDDKFLTLREIDIISCFTSGKSSKSLSYFLGISQKTFDTHWNNIKNKHNFSSRENLINHLEETNTYWTFYNFYLFLKMEEIYKNYHKKCTYEKKLVITCFEKSRKNQIYLELLKRHYEYIGCSVSLRFLDNTYNENKPFITIKNESQKKLNIFNQSPEKEIKTTSKNTLYLNQETHHFEFICKTLSFFGCENIFETNEKLSLELEKVQKLMRRSNNSLEKNLSSPQEKIKDKRYGFVMVFIVLFTTFFSFYIVSSANNLNQKKIFIPFAEQLIKRDKHLDKIKEIIEKQEGICTCVLVGIMGSGKTTLAKQYTCQTKHPISFEINCHSFESLERSFFEMAYQLIDNIQQKQDLDTIRYDNDPSSKRKKLLAFISTFLKKHKGWILIFDGVNSIDDIKDYLPNETKIWGKGSVIITTHNNNLIGSFGNEQVLKLEELTQEETHDFIAQSCRVNEESDKKEIQALAHVIPAFPLDITLVCSYFKQNKVKISAHLLESDQKKYFEERRYILEKSFNRFLNKQNQNIFFFLSLCDFKNIPKEFLYKFFSKEFVQESISNFKKYSLITDDTKDFFSIHPFVQKQMLTYIFENYDQETITLFLNDFIENVMKNIITNEEINSEVYEQVVVHFYALLNNLRKLGILDYEVKLNFILGHCHYKGTRFLMDAKTHFEYVLASNHSFLENAEKKEIFYFLSVLYNDIGFDEMALCRIEEGLKLCEKNLEKAKFLCQKGCILTLSNQIKSALTCFNSALELIDSLPNNAAKINLASTIYQEMAWLFIINQLTKNSGKVSLSLMEKASVYLPKEIKKGIPKTACYYYTTLGSIYCKLGEYDKALKEGFFKAIDIIEQRYDGKTHHISKLLIGEGMAECYLRRGKIKKATIVLNNMLSNAYKMRGKSYISLFIPKALLMECYVRSGKFDAAEGELLEILKYDISTAPNAYLFMSCILHYNAAHLFSKKKDFEKAKLYFDKFFTLISAFLEKTYGFKTQEQKELCMQNKENINSEDDCLLLEKQACVLLKTIYPKIDFSFQQKASSMYF